MSKRIPEILIADMLDALQKIDRFVTGMTREHFLADEKTVDAVVRNLEIIGEAANRLPDEYKKGHSDIEWNKIVGLRHRIVHDYFGIDLEVIWSIIERDLPALKNALVKISD